jgi:predicted nucleotidyltransferase
MPIKQIEEIIKKEILTIKTIKMIYLFGSVLTPAFNDNSDVDCAIYCDELDFAKSYYNTKTEIEFMIKRDLDFVNLKEADPTFATEIITTGKLLYAEDEDFKDRYEMNVLAEYLTLEEDRAIVMENIYNTGRVF